MPLFEYVSMHIIVMNFILSLCLFCGLCQQKTPNTNDHKSPKKKHSIKLITLLRILIYSFKNFHIPIDSSPILYKKQNY